MAGQQRGGSISSMVLLGGLLAAHVPFLLPLVPSTDCAMLLSCIVIWRGNTWPCCSLFYAPGVLAGMSSLLQHAAPKQNLPSVDSPDLAAVYWTLLLLGTTIEAVVPLYAAYKPSCGPHGALHPAAVG